MKRLWNVVAFLAVVNLLGLLGMTGWMWSTGRLSRERMQGIRKLFGPTLTEESETKAAEQVKVEVAQSAAAEAHKMGLPPSPATSTIEDIRTEHEGQFQIAMRRLQEVETLKQSLAMQMSALEKKEQQLRADRAAFETERRRVTDVDGDAQFKSALATLETLKPKDAKLVLSSLLAARAVEQVISYLAGMDESKRGKVLAEFVKEDPAVAAELLERLRTRGVAVAQTDRSGAVASASSTPYDPNAAEPGLETRR